MSNAERLYQLLITTMLLLDDSDNRFYQQYGVTGVRFHTLRHIFETPGISLSALSQSLLCTKGNTTRVVQHMENDGYIRREINPSDNRAAHLYLTAAGETFWLKLRQAHHAFNQSRFESLSTEAQNALEQDLMTLNKHMYALIHTQNS